MIDGWYYLHTDGNMIYKRDADNLPFDFRDSDFVVSFWPLNLSDREGAWRILIEGLAAGANTARINDLAKKWGCTNDDAMIYARRVGCNIYMDGHKWCATDMHFINLQESHAGFGQTALEAMSNLCRALGYKPSKMWGNSFADLLSHRENSQFGVGA